VGGSATTPDCKPVQGNALECEVSQQGSNKRLSPASALPEELGRLAVLWPNLPQDVRSSILTLAASGRVAHVLHHLCRHSNADD